VNRFDLAWPETDLMDTVVNLWVQGGKFFEQLNDSLSRIGLVGWVVDYSVSYLVECN